MGRLYFEVQDILIDKRRGEKTNPTDEEREAEEWEV